MRDRSTLKSQAFEEYKVTRQTSTGNGELYCGYVTLSMESPVPAGFVRNELGYDGPVGTRLQRMTPQAELDRMHQNQESVAAPDALPIARKSRRETPESRRAKLQQMRLRAELQLRTRAA